LSNVCSNSPSVVGLTLNFRDAKRTVRCVRSLLADGVAHVLVWDNSDDGACSVDELRAMLGEETRVSFSISDSNLGFSAGVNRGREWIESRFPDALIFLINNDAEILSGTISIMVGELQQSPVAVIAYPKIDHGGHCIGTVFYQRYFGFITKEELPGSVAYASGCCQLLDPKRLIGCWFDEAFFMYGEDMELGHRLGTERMLYVPELLVRHEGSASSGMGSVFYETRMVAAHWMLAPKLARSRFDLVALYTGRILALSLRAVLRAMRYRSSIPIKSLWDGLRLARQ
jgi:N-acetylglucosaminyl-diphospho-decaprenol L-rhamnosyltransferase